MIIHKNEIFRIKELLNTPGYRNLTILSLLKIIVTRSVNRIYHSEKIIDILYRNEQKLLIDKSIQVNKSSKTHRKVLRVCLTYKCNRSCSYCYAYKLQSKFPEDMKLSDYDFLTKWAKSLEFTSIRLLGGEPTIYPGLGRVIEISRKRKLNVSFSTNGLYTPEIRRIFKSDIIESINFSYPQDQLTKQEEAVFLDNLESAINNNIPVLMSWVVTGPDNKWNDMIQLAKKYRNRIAIRFHLAFPGGKNTSLNHYHLRDLSKQVFKMALAAHKNKIRFFIHRPILPCMFSADELEYFNSISPFLFDTYCLCNHGGGNTTTMLTVNPDLTTYPCPGLHIKGMRINSKTSREDIESTLNSALELLCGKLLMESCSKCELFRGYKNLPNTKYININDNNICQGGCLAYRHSE